MNRVMTVEELKERCVQEEQKIEEYYNGLEEAIEKQEKLAKKSLSYMLLIFSLVMSVCYFSV